MKKLSLLIAFLIIASCNAPAENSEKKAGYLKAGDTTYDLSLGDHSAVEIWDQYLDAHNDQDLEAIKALESEMQNELINQIIFEVNAFEM